VLKTGVYAILTINAAILTAYNNETKTAQVIIDPTTVTVTASGCTVGTDSASVELGTLDVRTLPDVGDTSPSGAFNVSLTCDEQVALYAVMTDQDDAIKHLLHRDPDRRLHRLRGGGSVLLQRQRSADDGARQLSVGHHQSVLYRDHHGSAGALFALSGALRSVPVLWYQAPPMPWRVLPFPTSERSAHSAW
jgi:hypothetical protein